MGKLSVTKIEKKAINILEAIINEQPNMDYQIKTDDKEMSWDGFLLLYRESSEKQSKKSFEARIPIQIKGHQDDRLKYLNCSNIRYSVDIQDLEVYATEKGIIYFQIFFNGTRNEIFYISLYPSRIADYLEKARVKKNKSTIRLPFTRLEKNPNSLYIIAKQFSDESKKQGTAFTPLVENRIRSNDFNRLVSVKLTVVGAKNNEDILRRLPSGDICIYGKMEGDSYFRPIETQDGAKFFIGKDLFRTISIEENVFYKKYKYIEDSEGIKTLRLSANLIIKMAEGRIDFNMNSSIKEAANDARFLLKLNEKGEFQVDGKTVVLNNIKISKNFEEYLNYVVDLYRALDMIGFRLNLDYSKCSNIEKNQLNKLVELLRNEHSGEIAEGISKYNWKYDDKYYPLLIVKNGDNVLLETSVYSKRYTIYIPEQGEEKRNYKMPMFIYHNPEILGNLALYNYDHFYEQINDCDITDETGNILTEAVLIMIEVFDVNKDVEFLKLADYLLGKIEQFIPKEIFLLNRLQIKKRREGFDNDDITQLKGINEGDVMISFGKQVLLENKESAASYFEQMTDETKEICRNFPIYHLFKML